MIYAGGENDTQAGQYLRWLPWYHFFCQVSVTATTSSFLDVTNSVKGAVLHLIDRKFIVDILIFFAAGPGLRLMSPESSRIIDNLSE